MTKIVLKHGTGVPSDTDLEVAEVAIDNVSGAMYTKLADDSVKHLNEGGASDWGSITGKPTEYPPEDHDHDGVYQPVGDYIEDADSDGKQYARKDGAWSEVVIPDGGSIQDGDTVGQITTWSGTEWTPEAGVVVNGGNVDIGQTGLPQKLSVNGQASFVESGTPDGSFLISPTSSGATNGGVDFYVRNGGWSKTMSIDANSNVGIGTDSPAAKLDLGDSTGQKFLMWSSAGAANNIRYGQAIETSEYRMFAEEQASLTFGHMARSDGVTYTERMRIDASGRVGIGGTPGTRSTKEIEEEAEATLANWKSQLDERLKAEPKADKKAVTQEITGHEKMPTKAELIKKLTERNIGGGTAKLQVNGTIFTSTSGQASSIGGIKIGENGTNVESTIGVLALKSLTNEHISFYPGGNYLGVWYPDGTLAVNWGNKLPIPEAGTAKLQVNGDGYFSGTVNAQKFVGDGSGLTGISAGGNYVPLSGNSTVNGTITATDFIATSDERLKDDISPLPVGLIDDIKPVQWNWKDGSGKSAGVIAQQLQAIGLDDFVNEDADGNLGVNYNALVGVLLAEVISLKAEVEALK